MKAAINEAIQIEMIMFEASMDEIRAAENRLDSLALRTPLIRLNYPESSAEIYLKLENLQPVGAFKIRCMGNLLKSQDADELSQGVYTASSGKSGYAQAKSPLYCVL